MAKFILIFLILLNSQSAFAFGDPTRPPMNNVDRQPVVNRTINNPQPLTAIFNRGKKRFAIIEDQIYYVGDRYQGAQIIKISDDKVLLRSAEGTRQLTLIHSIKK